MDLLQSLMEVLMPQAQAATPPGGQPQEGPLPPGFRVGGGLGGLPTQQAPEPMPNLAFGKAPLPVTDSLREVFAPPASPAPMRQPMPPQQMVRRPGPTPAEPQQAVTGADVQRFIRSVATGAGRADPRAPGVSAFAQGAMGATQNSYAEAERDKTQALAERRADTADRRADNALAMQGARDQRAEDEYRRKVTRDERVDAERQVRIQERMEKIASLKDPRVRHQDIKAFNEEMRGKAKLLQMQVRDGALTPEKAEILLEEHRRNVVEQYATRNPGAKAPATGGSGTQEAPHRLDGLAPDAAKAKFNQFKSGDYYINPADGRVYKKN